MTTGYPEPPTYRSILLGVLLAILLFLGLFRIGVVAKAVGAMFMWLPEKLGLIEMVYPEDVIEVDIERSPSRAELPASGPYLVYTKNLDLLTINDAVVESDAPPWLSVASQDGRAVSVELIERGLIMFDTPFAPGRPVARFGVSEPGTVDITHPRRPDKAFLVPDYITGRIELLTMLTIIQLGLFGYPLYSRAFRRSKALRDEIRAKQLANRQRVEGMRQRRAERARQAGEDGEQNVWRPKR